MSARRSRPPRGHGIDRRAEGDISVETDIHRAEWTGAVGTRFQTIEGRPGIGVIAGELDLGFVGGCRGRRRPGRRQRPSRRGVPAVDRGRGEEVARRGELGGGAPDGSGIGKSPS